MRNLLRFAVIAAALAAVPASAADPARPSSVTANKPSESGAQSSMPTGAATGAGQPQGPQVEVAGSAKARADATKGTGTKPAKKVKKKKARKHRSAKRSSTAAGAGGDTAQGTR